MHRLTVVEDLVRTHHATLHFVRRNTIFRSIFGHAIRQERNRATRLGPYPARLARHDNLALSDVIEYAPSMYFRRNGWPTWTAVSKCDYYLVIPVSASVRVIE